MESKDIIISILKEEIENTTGCTDPGAVCLAAARAAEELGQRPQGISIVVSPNIYKNGMNVYVPGSGRRGLHIAAAIGTVIAESKYGLDILNHVDIQMLAEAEKLLRTKCVEIRYEDSQDPLFIRAEASAGRDNASATILGDYSNIVEVTHNGRKTYSADVEKKDKLMSALCGYKLEELFRAVEQMEPDELQFLLDAAMFNKKSALSALNKYSHGFGASLCRNTADLPQPFSAMNKAQIMTGAAGEARMLGMSIPIMAICGSGNLGITNFLGILSVAEDIGSSREKLLKALAISSLVTIYVKKHIKRMTAVCGCSVAASTGVAAGTVYLLGGDYECSVHAMNSVIGTLAGMLCDGAKETCAYKMSSAVFLAIQFAFQAMENIYIPFSIGIMGNNIEDTLENLGLINNPGMAETDRLMLQLIEKVQLNNQGIYGKEVR